MYVPRLSARTRHSASIAHGAGVGDGERAERRGVPVKRRRHDGDWGAWGGGRRGGGPQGVRGVAREAQERQIHARLDAPPPPRRGPGRRRGGGGGRARLRAGADDPSEYVPIILTFFLRF